MLLVVIFGGMFFPVLAQVSFSSLPIDQALKKAGEEGKILMLVLDTKACARCNEITTMSLLEPAAKELNDSCVVIRPAVHSSDFANMQKRFAKDSTGTGGAIFFNSQGDVLAVNYLFSPTGAGYVLLLKTPFKVIQLIKQLRVLEGELKHDTSNILLLEQVMELRYRMGWQADSLANVYFHKLPSDSLSSDRVLRLLYRSAPLLGSQMDTVVRKSIYVNGNRALLNIASPEMQDINRKIIYKSRSKAIKTKDLKYAAQVASFAKHVSGGSPKGESYFYREMLNYCSAVKDTLNYFRMAETLVNQFLLKMPTDSVLKNDQQLSVAKRNGDTSFTSQSYFYGPTIDGGALVGSYKLSEKIAEELNIISWRTYELYKKPSTLKTALQWSKKSLDYHVLPAYYDTYARLLYVTGEPEKAMEVMKMAIQLGIRQLTDVTIFQMALETMKKGMSLPDPS